eukprot:gene29748-biopygen5514
MHLNDETDTHDAFKIVATTGAMVGSVHVAWIAGRVARRTLVRRWDFLVLYSNGIRRCVSFAVFSALAFACIQVSERMSSNHSPFETVARVFYSGLVLTACFLALQTTGIVIFTYVFFSHRKKVWGTISANEASIMDRPDISRAFSNADIALLSYPFCAVVIASMWGYPAFGQGFDMFKTYMLAASFLVSQLQERIRFMVTMATQRPFDIGDILLLDGGPFRVRDFTTNHAYLDGTTALTVRNSVLLGDTVRNMTRGAVKDKVVMSLPVTTSNDTVVKVREALQGYARENPDEVEEGLVRTGWTCVEGGIAKVMSVHWSYTFVVHDVNRFNKARTTV